MKIPLSIVILTRNEEKNIEKCIKSANLAAEVIVLDDNSTDKTTSLAKSLSAKVFTRSLASDFAAQRNYAQELAAQDWILFLDADEELSAELKKEIIETVAVGRPVYLKQSSVYRLKRRDFFWNTELKHGETMRARSQGIVRLLKKGSGVWKGSVHETFVTSEDIGTLNGFINHYPHQSVKEFLGEINVYSTLRAKELLHSGKKTNVFQIMFYPFFKFLLTYFGYRGFLDGPAGYAYSFFMSFHSFLVRAKLYQYSHFGNGK